MDFGQRLSRDDLTRACSMDTDVREMSLDLSEEDKRQGATPVPRRGRPRLDLGLNQSVDLAKSFEVDNHGTLKIGGFQINAHGVKFDPPKGFGCPSMAIDGEPVPSRQIADSKAISSIHSADQFIQSTKELIKLGDIGRGACGTVEKALHLPTLRMVAVKHINILEKAKRHQFVKELSTLSCTTDSPNVIQLYGAFYEEGRVSMALEYMNRSSLSDVIRAQGALPEPTVRFLSRQQTFGSDWKGSDIKPGNILVNSKGECKLADFGVLAALEHTHDHASTRVGTVMYMSPERVHGSYGAPADIWSFGMTVYTMAAGSVPFDMSQGYFGVVRHIREKPPPQLSPAKFSGDLCSFVQCCLAPDPAHRWTAAQLLQHPFLAPVEAEQCPQELSSVTQQDATDLQRVLSIVLHENYIRPAILPGQVTKPRPVPYRRSLFELARFQKVADALQLPVADVQRMFEAIYVRYMQTVQSQGQQAQQPQRQGWP